MMDKPFRQLRNFRLLSGLSWRVLALGLFMVGGLGVLSAKLWYEQVTRQKKWSERLKKGSFVTVRIPSVRGEIRDRNGITLVANRRSYGVDFYLPQMERGYREMNAGKVPVSIFRTTNNDMLEDRKIADIVQIVNSTVIPSLKKLDLARDYNAAQLERHFRTNEQVPFAYLDDVDFDSIARLSENDAGLSGVEVAIRPVRQYIYGAFAAHVLGYTGAPEDINKEADIKAFTYYQPDVVGRSNVELTFDKYLRGKSGKRVLERTVKNKIGAEIERVAPTPGSHVYLTIDARIQMIVEKTLRQADVGRGSVVVTNPNNGDILAMASVPDYDPNIFVPKISAEDMQRLDDAIADPLVNRAVQGYAPGSTYKAVTALAGLSAGIPVSRAYNCSGSFTYGNRAMKCWIFGKGAHGTLDLSGAIKNSCNCYFFQLGNAANIQAIESVGEALGLGTKTGIALSGEHGGILPGPKWLTATGQAAMVKSASHTANVSIGQGEVEASPLQIAMVCSTLANGGTSYYPRLVSRIVDSQGSDVRDGDGSFAVPVEPKVRSNLRDLGVTADQIESIRRGMWRVVNEAGGTGKRAQIKGVEVAGKTGTAQFWRKEGNERVKDNHVWFMCFAPYKQPKYAICVMIQGAKSGGGVAAPVAQKILKECLALEAGYSPQITWVNPQFGSLEQISEITLKEDGSLNKLVATAFTGTDQRPDNRHTTDDEETADHADGPLKPSGNDASGARPDVSAPADARGQVGGMRKPSIWQRIFGPSNKPTQPTNGGPRR